MVRNYIEKRAFREIEDAIALRPEAVRMLNYMNAAANNAGYTVPSFKFQSSGSILQPGPAVGKFGSGYAMLGQGPSFSGLSHEMGHLAAGHPDVSTALRFTPILGELTTLGMESQANLKSWDMLKNMYKDDPELLAAISKDRWRTLPRCFSSYVLVDGVPLATTALGGYYGYRKYRNAKNLVDKQRQAILANKRLTDVDRRTRLAALKNPSKLDTIGGQALAGYLGGKIGGLLVNTVINNPWSIDRKLEQSEQRFRDSGMQDMLKRHAINNGYYTPELDSDLSGVYNNNPS